MAKKMPKGPINVTVRSGQSLGANVDTGPGNKGLVLVSWKQGEGTVLQDKGVVLGMVLAAIDGNDILQSPSTEIINLLQEKYHNTKVLSFVAPPPKRKHAPKLSKGTRSYTKGFKARPKVERHWHDNIPLDQITAQQQGVEVAWIVATQRHRRQVKAAAMTLSVHHLARYKSRRMKRKKEKAKAENRGRTLSDNFMPGSPGKGKKKVYPVGMLKGAGADGDRVKPFKGEDDEAAVKVGAGVPCAASVNNFMEPDESTKLLPPTRKRRPPDRPAKRGPAEDDEESEESDDDEEFNA